MKDEKWGEVLDRILTNFKVLSREQTKEGVSDIETLIFEAPIGKIKMVRTVKPVVLDKKIIGAHRRGKSAAQYEYIYSPDEKSSTLAVYREVGGEWEAVDADNLIK
ncbi:hypothetical protein A2810_03020 [candidate division Kazan bacterium RIFCSPHIGHO2_01_FULL_49_10]|uniref:Uncharacterized protein n=1 Tax=candidate division Kazan bacterium RIFCSPLOWO2_01_FULL_48_13 TaxID=1798539 RepID=A0A1F4PNW9_UNCK3|nr:MAG: hypothetical protein A2810_03020 [candidate division Kazan bacterium RIFCSPHIGHO2_01_FULL_49_10]OGB85348.1 MAG: hypothetical protein A2994_01810 [candidate division Kazan bacterium RIFCSPLOWO2_01_FULL_48_13]